MHAIALVVCALALLGCRDGAPAAPTRGSAAPAVDASDLIAKYECTRCHEVPRVAAAVRDKHCVRCHQEIHAGTFASPSPEVLAKWQSRITSLRWVPSLAGADRLDRAWVREFLLAPHDVRPSLAATMPRLALSRDEAERLAAHFVPEVQAAASLPFDLARGEALYRGLACGRCHRFTGAAVDDPALHHAGATQPTAADGAWALAPDLRFARTRVRPAALAQWIASPRGAMPKLGVSIADAELLAGFIAMTPLAPVPVQPPITRLPVLDREVTWAEVEQRVFRHVCWHCHAVPDYARGDGGPGNSGGFGFAGRALDLSSYDGIASGSLDDTGEPRSVFGKLADGTPRIVAHLYARHAEIRGQIVDGIRGMPLGLPPIPVEDIQLVETWIAQGRPQ